MNGAVNSQFLGSVCVRATAELLFFVCITAMRMSPNMHKSCVGNEEGAMIYTSILSPRLRSGK